MKLAKKFGSWTREYRDHQRHTRQVAINNAVRRLCDAAEGCAKKGEESYCGEVSKELIDPVVQALKDEGFEVGVPKEGPSRLFISWAHMVNINHTQTGR